MDTNCSRVLFALTSKERNSFLPGFSLDSFPDLKDDWIDTHGITTEEWNRQLRELRPQVIVSAWGTPALPLKSAMAEEIPLHYVCHLTGSVRSLVTRDWVESGLLVTNWGTSISHTMAEHAMLLVLGSLRNQPRWKACIDAGDFWCWETLQTRSLRGRRVGIHGFGAIAREVVAMLKPFGVTLSAYSQGVPTELFQEHGVRSCDSLRDLFATSEVFIECEALTPQTRGSVNKALLELLPEGAVFVNVGRGLVVEEEALAQLAAQGKIRIALDVFQCEPLPPDSPLRGIPDAILSPHIAGPTQGSLSHCGDFALKNLRHYLRGEREQMQGVVTLEVYDRIT